MALKVAQNNAEFISSPIEQGAAEQEWLSYTPVLQSRRLSEVLAGYISPTTLALKPGTVPSGTSLIVKKSDGTLAEVDGAKVTNVAGDPLRFDDGVLSSSGYFNSSIGGVAVSGDGKWFYDGRTSGVIYYKNVATAWDTASAVSPLSYTLPGITFTITGLYITPDGRTLFAAGASNAANGIAKYNLLVPYNPTSAVHVMTKMYGAASVAGSADITTAAGVHFSEDGKNMYVVSKVAAGTVTIYQYKFSNALDLNTMTYHGIKSWAYTSMQGYDIQISPCGNYAALLLKFSTTAIAIDLYSLATPFDITTLNTVLIVQESTTTWTTPVGFELKPDGGGMIILEGTGATFLKSTWTSGSYYSYQSVDVTALSLTEPPTGVYMKPEPTLTIDAKPTVAELRIATAAALSGATIAYSSSGDYVLKTDTFPKMTCNARAVQFKITAPLANTEISSLNIQLTKDA